MPLSLRDKLKAVDAPRKSVPPPQSDTTRDCWHGSDLVPLANLPGALEMPIDMVRLMEPQPLPDGLRPEKILYLDTETTGLSGGAGTLAFLLGVGYLTEAGFYVHQYLMRDYPEERCLLENLRALLPRFDALCTFNGKSFDLPLLFSRFRMNRMETSALEKPHIDLLHLARRLWKLRLGRCSLSRLEESIFGMPREDDLPGSQVPERYFAYLKSGNFALLKDVLTHNHQDIVSLCRLLVYMAGMYRSPEEHPHAQDVFAMGVALEKNRHVTQARRCYRLATRGRMGAFCRCCLARSYRRSGEFTQAKEGWAEMIRRREGWIEPYVELAKLYEHQEKDYAAALEIVQKGLALLAEPSLREPQAVQDAKNALQYRYARLQRKLERRETQLRQRQEMLT